MKTATPLATLGVAARYVGDFEPAGIAPRPFSRGMAYPVMDADEFTTELGMPWIFIWQGAGFYVSLGEIEFLGLPV